MFSQKHHNTILQQDYDATNVLIPTPQHDKASELQHYKCVSYHTTSLPWSRTTTLKMRRPHTTLQSCSRTTTLQMCSQRHYKCVHYNTTNVFTTHNNKFSTLHICSLHTAKNLMVSSEHICSVVVNSFMNKENVRNTRQGGRHTAALSTRHTSHENKQTTIARSRRVHDRHQNEADACFRWRIHRYPKRQMCHRLGWASEILCMESTLRSRGRGQQRCQHSTRIGRKSIT